MFNVILSPGSVGIFSIDKVELFDLLMLTFSIFGPIGTFLSHLITGVDNAAQFIELASIISQSNSLMPSISNVFI